MNLAMQNTVLV